MTAQKPTFLLLVLTILIKCVKCDLYSAIVEMEKLVETESVLVTTLNDYINDVQLKLTALRQHHQKYYKEHVVAKKDVERYVSNPINAFLLMKRLTTDWKRVESLVKDVSNMNNKYPIINKDNENNNVTIKLPNDEDLHGAAVALIRLQDTYRLETAALANGVLNGVQYETGLSGDDCFEIGRHLSAKGDYYHTILWMNEAKNRFHLYGQLQQKQEGSKKMSTRNITAYNGDKNRYILILEFLAFSIFMEGNLPVAINLTKEVLELDPNHSRAKDNLVIYEDEINALGENIKSDGVKNSLESYINEPITVREKRRLDYDLFPKRGVYEMLCRNEIKPSPKVLAKLKCRYRTKRNKFTWIAPFKEEEMSLEPLIVIYHQVLSDDEINTIKQLALARLSRATVLSHDANGMIVDYRLSKSAWLETNEHKHIDDVDQRIEDITELTQTTAEILQVVNYGIGGHYEPHFDFARKNEKNLFKQMNYGNRIATILFYMSDVLQGGATVFPAIKTALWPEKGSAAFWYNLHPSGEGDYLTEHAACPVLSGSKWVANKWIHERGQEFLRPCRLEPDPIEPNPDYYNNQH